MKIPNKQLEQYEREANYQQSREALLITITAADLLAMLTEIKEYRLFLERRAERMAMIKEAAHEEAVKN